MACLQSLDADHPEFRLVAASRSMAVLRHTVDRIAEGDAKVLITGESGVGKDLVARLIHLRSKRGRRAFVAVNCGAFTETLLETELFGHVRGSFSGAYRDKVGKLQQADGGTIFLDELGEMSLHMQAMLLRFVETGELQPVGSDAVSRRVDVRIVAATNRNLSAMVSQGTFREDLMYRLKVIHLHVPPLRERPEDIRLLIQHALARTGRGISFSEEALQALVQYRWPGNVRELQNVIEQVSWQPGAEVIRLEDLPEEFHARPLGRTRECDRRRHPADDLYDGLIDRRYRFWDDIRRMFMDREIAKRDLRRLISRGLAATGGNYHAIVTLFGMPESDYKRLLNFLSSHDCVIDFHPYRTGHVPASPRVFGKAAHRGGGSDSEIDPITSPD